MAKELTQKLSRWTRRTISYELRRYGYLDKELSELRVKQPGMVVFVFRNREPADYFMVAYELSESRVKRIRQKTLVDRHERLTLAERGQLRENDNHSAKQQWSQFITLSALDVLEQLVCIPYAYDENYTYEATLAIDVAGAGRRYFGLSLFVSRQDSSNGQKEVRLSTDTYNKTDLKHETISDSLLAEKIVELISGAGYFQKRPLESLLILRDGRECGNEMRGINTARDMLVREGLLRSDARLDVVDLHKKTLTGIRVWQRGANGAVHPTLDGTAIQLSSKLIILACTGAPTLPPSVTPAPILLEARSQHVPMLDVAKVVYAGSHLNWSSPRMAQRLPLVMKQTDDALKSKMSQEVRRFQ